MSVAKWILAALVIICLSLTAYYATKDKLALFSSNSANNTSGKTFQGSQTELNKKRQKREILPRYPPSEVTLKNGDLYELNRQTLGALLTITGGKIDGYLQSPDKRYVAYSLIVGYTEDAGDYEKGEKIPQVPIHHIIVMDLGLRMQLTEIKPQNIEPFIDVKRWTSNEELELYGSTGLSVDSYYFYNVVSNELRQGDLDDLE